MKFILNHSFEGIREKLTTIIQNFDQGILFADGQRNKIRLFEVEGRTLNIKSFKIPNLINKIAYRFIRKSKAQRSFEYANKLIENGIGTPEPIAYIENINAIGLADSYYISAHLETELTFRELVTDPNYPDRQNVLRQFTRFCFLLHERGIEFLDHSPGNTLIKKVGEGQYAFYLVDLNRMTFHETMPLSMRMKNLSRLTPKEEMVRTMSNEYAAVSGIPETQIFEMLWNMTCAFQYRYFRKKRIKKKLYFWK